MYTETTEQLITDGELIKEAATGNSISFTILFNRYLPLIHKVGRQYYFKQLDRDDWEQESQIVLFKVVKNFNPDKSTKFSTFFRVCLKNKASDILRKERRIKKTDGPISFEQADRELVDNQNYRPDEASVCSEEIEEFIKSCSQFEKTIFQLITAGENKNEIKQLLGCDERSITGAVCRCRQKLKLAMR